jgi:hypothetical protein
VRRGIYERFPFLFSCIIFDLPREIIVPLISHFSHNPNTYFYAYWLAVPLEYCFTLLIIFEVFVHLFHGYIKYSKQTIRIFLAFALALFAFSTFIIVYPSIPTDTMVNIILTINRSFALIICGLLLFMWIFARHLGLSFRHHVWGIVVGFALYSSVSLAVAAIHATTGEMCPSWITPLPHIAYFVSTIFWTAYLLHPEPQCTIVDVQEYQNLITSYRAIVSDLRKAIK